MICFSGYSCSLYHWIRPPQYSWNIVERKKKNLMISNIYLKVRIYIYLSFVVCFVIFQISYSTKYIHVGKLHAWKKHRDDFWCATKEYEGLGDMKLPVIVRSNADLEFCSWCSFFIINLSIIVFTNGGINGAPGITHCWSGIAHGFTKWTPV